MEPTPGTPVNVAWTMVFFRFLGDVHGGAAHDVAGNSQVGSRWVNSSINLCDLFTAQGLSYQMLIVVGRLEAVYFSSFSMLVASVGELVRQASLMEGMRYKQAVNDFPELGYSRSMMYEHSRAQCVLKLFTGTLCCLELVER